MLEKTIEKKVCLQAKQLGWLCYKFVSPAQRGVPDRVFFRDGVTIFIEFKSLGKSLSVLQLKQHTLLAQAGFQVFVIDSVDAGITLFASFEEFASAS